MTAESKYKLNESVREAANLVFNAIGTASLCAAGLDNAVQGIDFKPFEGVIEGADVEYAVLYELRDIVETLRRAYDLLA